MTFLDRFAKLIPMTTYTDRNGDTHTIVRERAAAYLASQERELIALVEGRTGRQVAYECGEDHLSELVKKTRADITRMRGVLAAVDAGVEVLPKHLCP